MKKSPREPKPYPSDVSDEEWSFVVRYLTLCRLDAPQRDYDLRDVFNALRYLVRSGVPWRMMPHDFPPWHAVQQQTQRWLRAAILGFTELLRRGYDRNRQDSAKFLNTIHASGTHLVELINDILDLSKIEAGQMKMERIAFAPHRIVREVVTVLTQKAAEKGMALGLDVAGPLPEAIESDPRRLRQIVTNLVGNALKFTERGGVRIVLGLAGEPGGSLLRIEVRDTGIGVAAHKIEAIFDPFVQADASVTRASAAPVWGFHQPALCAPAGQRHRGDERAGARQRLHGDRPNRVPGVRQDARASGSAGGIGGRLGRGFRRLAAAVSASARGRRCTRESRAGEARAAGARAHGRGGGERPDRS